MPFYRYKHECGYKNTQFLKVDKESVVLTCERCGKGVSARQVRDKAVAVAENNEVHGVFRHESNADNSQTS